MAYSYWLLTGCLLMIISSSQTVSNCTVQFKCAEDKICSFNPEPLLKFTGNETIVNITADVSKEICIEKCRMLDTCLAYMYIHEIEHTYCLMYKELVFDKQNSIYDSSVKVCTEIPMLMNPLFEYEASITYTTNGTKLLSSGYDFSACPPSHESHLHKLVSGISVCGLKNFVVDSIETDEVSPNSERTTLLLHAVINGESESFLQNCTTELKNVSLFGPTYPNTTSESGTCLSPWRASAISVISKNFSCSSNGLLINETVCSPCQVGHYSVSGYEPCQPCPKNFYGDKIGSKSCQECASGSYTTSEKSTSSLDCINGCVPKKWKASNDSKSEETFVRFKQAAGRSHAALCELNHSNIVSKPPCMSQLGIRVDAYDDSFRFDLAVSSGVAEDVRLNGKQAWIPNQLSDSYVQINLTKAVLLTGLQIQGDTESSGRLTAWTLQTSLDCVNYRTEIYTMDYRNTLQASTVLLKNVEFVTCIILRPTEYKGKSPALRLELLGCELSESDKCHHTATPVSDEWMADGGRQLNYDHDNVLVWIQVQLDLDLPGDFGEVGIYYSRNCQSWKFYEPLDMNIVSLTSPDQRDRLVTLELNTPVRAKCLRIFPPLAARIREVQTNECSGRLASRLHDNKAQDKHNMKKFGEDANAYQDEPSCLHQMASQDDAPVLTPDKKPPENLMDIISKGNLQAEGDSKKYPPEDGKELPNPLIKQQPDQSLSTPSMMNNTERQNIEIINDLASSDLIMPSTKSSFSTTSAELILPSHEIETSTHTVQNNESPEPMTVTQEPPLDQFFSGIYEKFKNVSQANEPEEILKENGTLLLEDNVTFIINTTKPSGDDLMQDTSIEVKPNKSLNMDPSESILVPMVTVNNDIQINVDTLKESFKDVLTENNADSTTSDELARNNESTTRGELARNNESTTDTVSSQDLNNKNREKQISQHEDIQTSSHDGIQSKHYDILTSKHDGIQPTHDDTRTSTHDGIQSTYDDSQTSKHDGIQSTYDDSQTSKHDGIQSTYDDTQKSTHDGIQSTYDDSQTSKHDGIQSKHGVQTSSNDIQASNHDDVQTSLNSDNINLSNKTSSEALEEHVNSKENHYHHANETQTLNNNTAKINSGVNEETSSITTASPNLPTTCIEESDAQSSFKAPEVSLDETNANVGSISNNNGLLNDPPHCGIKPQEAGARRKRIIGGYKNSPGEWPWLVTMYFLPESNYTKKSGYKHICGASLIAPSWIITAGHCFSEAIFHGLGNASNWKIIVGLYDLEDDKNEFVQERLISDYIVYPTYDITTGPLIDDLALVRLNEPVQTSDMVHPICLDDTDIFYNETQCYVTGWGNVDSNSTGSRFPHTTVLTVLTQEKCKHMIDVLPDSNLGKPYFIITPPVLCASVGPEGQDACQGDSGGPMMCDIDGYWYQIGVVAAGLGCGNIEIPGLYTRISYFFDWINRTISGYQG